MELLMKILVLLAVNGVALYLRLSAINIFFSKNVKCSAIKKISIYTIYCLIGTITYFFYMTPYLNIFIEILLIYMLTSFFNTRNKNRLAFSLIWVVFGIIFEALVSMLLVSMASEPLEHILINENFRIIAIIISTLALLVLIKLIVLVKNSWSLSENLTFLDSIYVLVIPCCSIFMMHLLNSIAFEYNVENYVITSLCFMLIFINLVFYILFDKLKTAEKLKYEHAILKNNAEYYTSLEKHSTETFDKIREIKHDLKHNLLYLKASIEENSEQSLKNVEQKLDELLSDSIDQEIEQYTKNERLNRLLNYKLFSAKKQGIPIDIKTVISKEASLDEQSLYIILGNAIDNAIDNFDKTKTDGKLVLRIVDNSSNLLISVSNPYKNTLKFKNGLPETQKSDRLSHGVGLRSIKKIVAFKKGAFNISTDNNIFKLEILLYEEIR